MKRSKVRRQPRPRTSEGRVRECRLRGRENLSIFSNPCIAPPSEANSALTDARLLCPNPVEEGKYIACGGNWGAEHVLPNHKCDGIYSCYDRTDEEGCEKILPANLASFQSFPEGFNCG